MSGGQSRIQSLFQAVRASGKKLFVPYVVAGDPSRDASLRILNELPAAGADLIELGVPWSDPIADGPENQRAMMRALEGGSTTEGVLDLVAEARRVGVAVPIVLMSYVNPIFRMGYGAFATRAQSAGVDALLCTDLPPEEAEPLSAEARRVGLPMAYLHAPTTSDERARLILAREPAFLYVVARMGVTGFGVTAMGELRDRVRRLREPSVNPSGVPLLVGFGIGDREQAREVASFADGIVAGSVLSRAIGEAASSGADPAMAVAACVRALTGS